MRSSLGNVVELMILGQRLVIKSDEDGEYIRKVEEYLNTKIREVREKTKAVATLDLALLVALNVTGELLKAKEDLDSIESRSEELSRQIADSLRQVTARMP
jgi:cell division protein ZapA (FtsZ GTPase activity inhibitor)